MSSATKVREHNERLGATDFPGEPLAHKIVENTYFSNDEQFNFIAMVEPKDSSRITKGKIDEAITALKDLKPKERDDVSDREAVRKMRRYIEKLTSDKYGYTYDEVSEMLKGLGINLSGGRIKYLLGELKKSTRQRKKISSSDDKNSSSNPPAETQPTVKASIEASESPVKSTLGKSKNQRASQQSQSAE